MIFEMKRGAEPKAWQFEMSGREARPEWIRDEARAE
jgi:hypothetical protein